MIRTVFLTDMFVEVSYTAIVISLGLIDAQRSFNESLNIEISVALHCLYLKRDGARASLKTALHG